MDAYAYVGPPDRLRLVNEIAVGHPIATRADLLAFLAVIGSNADGEAMGVTYIVDTAGTLVVADRRTEHVVCAGGQPVCAAGEIFFLCTDTTANRANQGPIIIVEEASNQSTGYCPPTASWTAVAATLDRLQIPHPGHFTLVCEFRRCDACGQLAIVKDWLICEVCGVPLPENWNIGNQLA